jgi:hypothetical protein
MQLTVSVPAGECAEQEPEFIWSPELIAAVAADMDRGAALLGQRRYDTNRRCWVPVVKSAPRKAA